MIAGDQERRRRAISIEGSEAIVMNKVKGQDDLADPSLALAPAPRTRDVKGRGVTALSHFCGGGGINSSFFVITLWLGIGACLYHSGVRPRLLVGPLVREAAAAAEARSADWLAIPMDRVALWIIPHNTGTMLSLARLYERRADYRLAADYARRARSDRPGTPEPHLALARALRAMGSQKEARVEMARAQKLGRGEEVAGWPQPGFAP